MIASKTPLRISFMGGGTDFPDYYRRDYGCVVSTAINKYVYIIINRKFDDGIQLKYSTTETVDSVDEIKHPLIREAMRLLKIDGGIELSALADIPSLGSGLGSSSSFAIGVLNALHAFKNEHASAEQLAREACKVEIELLGEPIGKQDQYIGAFGGLNYIRFEADENVLVEPVRCKPETLSKLKKSLALYYTGITRKSSPILSEQKNNIASKIETLDLLRGMAEELRVSLANGDVDSLGEALHRAWLAKKSLAAGISSPALDDVYDKARAAGAIGGKILGAGGGGFFLFYVHPDRQAALDAALSGMKRINFDFEPFGSKIIYYG